MKFSEEQINHIKALAKDLIDDGENTEYTRGICELIADIDGKEGVFHSDRSEQIEKELLPNKGWVLSQRSAELLCRGAKMTGSFLEGLHYVMEEIYVDEYDDLEKFAKYIHEEIGGASMNNIFMVFKAYKNPDNKEAQAKVNELKQRIQEIKELTSG